jgi:hypothetical protein
MKGRPKGAKNKRSFIIENVLDQMASEQDRAMLRGYFKAHDLKPPEFWTQLAKISEAIREQIELRHEPDVLVLVSTDGRDNVCLASAALAMRRILEGSHRLANEDELRRKER